MSALDDLIALVFAEPAPTWVAAALAVLEGQFELLGIATPTRPAPPAPLAQLAATNVPPGAATQSPGTAAVAPQPAGAAPSVTPGEPTATPPAPAAQAVEALPGLEDALSECAPQLSDDDVDAWVAAMSDVLRRAGITTPRRIAGFVGQCAVESGGFRVLSENLNYSAQRLCQVWPSRFPNLAVANQYAHNPEKLANRVYSNRIGNRDEESGDGWRFRGRGLIQLTGRANYERFATSVGCTVEEAADRAATRVGAVETAAWFWNTNGLNAPADAWLVDGMTRKINGAMNAAAERRRQCDAALAAIGE